ncbi:MAG: 50S ribosomal protein L24e [Thermoplasmata archaeon]
MPAIKTCSFCGNPIEPGTGKMFIKKDGTIYNFCSRRCQSNLLEFGRNPRKLKWTAMYAKRGSPEKKKVVKKIAVATTEKPKETKSAETQPSKKE